MIAMLNERIKKFTVLDISMVKMSVFFFSIMAVKFFPELLNLGYPLLIILVIACGARPFYNIWIKK